MKTCFTTILSVTGDSERAMRRTAAAASIGALLLMAGCDQGAAPTALDSPLPGAPSFDHSTTLITPVQIDGNPTCSDLQPEGASWIELKVEPVEEGTYSLAGYPHVQVTISDIVDKTFDWSSTHGVSDVVVKGGPNANEYGYYKSPPAGVGGPVNSDVDLHAPKRTADDYYGLSHVSFCFDPTASKSGMKFHDLDADGVKDAGEPGLGGWTIFVDYDRDGVLDSDEPRAVTSSDAATLGQYTITGIEPGGPYDIREVLQTDWHQSHPSGGFYTEEFEAFEIKTGNDFGNYQNATKSGTKFEDLNANGIKNTDEPGLSGWTIQAWQGETKVAETTTDANGAYSLSLTPGSYTIKEVCTSGWLQSLPAPTNGCGSGVYNITLESQEVDSGNDFGNFRKATKSGVKFHDLDADGVKDSGEPLLSGWEITLVGTDGLGNAVSLSTLTDANGAYSFTVNPGTYQVCETHQSGWMQTFPTAGADCSSQGGGLGYAITLVSNETDSGNDFGNHEISQEIQGCTPGYWKNHTDEWDNTAFSTGDLVSSIFARAGSAPYADLGDDTLLEALDYEGGDTLEDKARILLRAAVASVLNASHPDVDFGMSVSEIQTAVNAALDSQDKDEILSLATELDGLNNSGCPLD